jgi:bifunctional N-acetylglucosamine-1-phosphate-uridyltransferase/glucosamine-1-phosphate-acetyltransferase GlmU-like protein
MRICAVIPAAGRGIRLGSHLPKLLTSLTPTQTIWSILHAKLSLLVDHIHLVLSPDGAMAFTDLPANVTYGIQPSPIGMGDAIFRGHETWTAFDAVLILWGDQVFVSTETLARAIAALGTSAKSGVLPVTAMAEPYVEYIWNDDRLSAVRQTREGDSCTPNGLSDVGTFLLSTHGLNAAWEKYLARAPRGGHTDEINFLPFLPFLAANDWTIKPLTVADATEARGINTKDDLAFFQSLYKDQP